jgi:multisubunit Na+/H+ antiporter MnhE subunit
MKYPTKRWRFLALAIWLFLAIIASIVSVALLTLGWNVAREILIIHWLDKTVAIIGYAAVAATNWLVCDFYKRLGYGR